MPPIIVAVGAAVASAAVASIPAVMALGSLAAGIIGAVASFAVGSLLQSIFTGGGSTSDAATGDTTPTENPTQNVRQAITTHKVIYGQFRVGGAFTFMDSNAGPGDLENANNGYLVLVVTMGGKYAYAPDGLYFNDIYVPLDSSGAAIAPATLPDGTEPQSFAGFADVVFGDGTVAGDQAFLNAVRAWSTKWTPDCYQAGRPKLVLRLKWDQDVFGSIGIPNISMVTRGTRIFDPRETATNLLTAGYLDLYIATDTSVYSVGDYVWISGVTGAEYIMQGRNYSLQGAFEVHSILDATAMRLYAPDRTPMVFDSQSLGGSVTKMYWSDNAALVVNDYLCDANYGFAAVYGTEVQATLLTAAANISDEMVDRANPATSFTADPTSDLITWAEGQAAGVLPNFATVLLGTSGVLPGGLSTFTLYYFAQQGATNSGYLCASLADAQAVPPVPVNITTAGTGTQSLTIAMPFTASADTDQLTLYANTLRILTGNKVQVYALSGGTLPTGLSAATDYYAILFTDSIIRLATSLQNARRGTYIDLTTDGSGPIIIEVLAEPRYTANGVLDSGVERQANLSNLLQSMAGYLVPSGSQIAIYAAAYRTPAVTLDEDDLRAEIKIDTLISAQESFNSVKGVFFDPFGGWQQTDIPTYQDDDYIADDDGEVVWADLQLQFVNSAAMGQRLAKIMLERIRRELTVTMPLNLTAFRIGAPDVIMVNNTALGWSAQTFETVNWQFQTYQDAAGILALGTQIVGRQTDSAVYAWSDADEQQAQRQGNTTLPNAFKPRPPTALVLASGNDQLFLRLDGTVFTRLKVSWTPPDDMTVQNGGYIECEYKKSSDSAWTKASAVPGNVTFNYILDVQDGVDYDVQLRSRNAAGAVSDTDHPWQCAQSNYRILGKTEPPPAVTAVTATVQQDGTVEIAWEYPNAPLDWASVDITVDGITINTSVTSFKYLSTADSLKQIASHVIVVNAVDTTGNRSAGAQLIFVKSPPANATDFVIGPVGPNSYISWTASVSPDIAYYRIKYSPLLTGVTWDSSFDVIPRISGRATSVALATMNGTYLIKAYDYGGNESTDAVLIANSLDEIAALNFVGEMEEDPDFPGEKINCYVNPDGVLELSGSDVIADWLTLSSVPSMTLGSGGLSPTGEYYFETYFDLGDIYTSRVTAVMNVGGNNLANVMSSWQTLSSVATLSGTDASKWGARLQIRTTSDDPAGSPVAWSEWADFAIADYTARAFEFRLLLSTEEDTVTPRVSVLGVMIDMPDRTLSDSDVAATGAGLTVLFDDFGGDFRATPALGIAAQNMQTGDYYTITLKTASGFTIRFFNSAGAGVARTFDWLAKSYGKVAPP